MMTSCEKVADSLSTKNLQDCAQDHAPHFTEDHGDQSTWSLQPQYVVMALTSCFGKLRCRFATGLLPKIWKPPMSFRDVLAPYVIRSFTTDGLTLCSDGALWHRKYLQRNAKSRGSVTLKLIIEKSLKFDDNLKKARHDTEVLKFCLGSAGEYTLTVHRTIANLTAFSDATSKSVLCTQAYEIVRSSENYETGE